MLRDLIEEIRLCTVPTSLRIGFVVIRDDYAHSYVLTPMEE